MDEEKQARNSFIFYRDWWEVIAELEPEEKLDILEELLGYAFDETTPKNPLSKLMTKSIGRNAEKWEEIKQKRREYGRRGGINSGISRSKTKQNEANEAKGSFALKQNEANEANEAVNVNANANANANVNANVINTPPNPLKGGSVRVAEKPKDEKPNPKKFTPPTEDEVQEYLAEKGESGAFDPEAFIDFYESNGWRVGKNPMKDWRASVRTWIKRRAGEGRSPTDDGQAHDSSYNQDYTVTSF